jgi:DNA-binding MarR family transcriptional regulator
VPLAANKQPPLNFVRIPIPDTDYELVRLTHVTREAINKLRQRELYQIGIHGRRSAILLTIDLLGDNATPNAIAELLFRRRHTISDLLTKMEVEGIIKKVYDLKKKNMVRVIFTEKGRRIMQQTHNRESIHTVMTVLSSAEQKQLHSILYKLRNGILTGNGMQRKELMFNSDDKLFNLHVLFTETTELMRAARRKELDEYNIRPSRSAFLLAIQSLDSRATPTLLARQLIREPHSVSEMLSKMEAEGIITRQTDTNKRNTVIVSLTEKGRTMYGHLLLGLSHRKTMAIITGEERQQLRIYMEKLLDRALQELKNG